MNNLYLSFMEKLKSLEKNFKKLIKEDLDNILLSNNLPKKSKKDKIKLKNQIEKIILNKIILN